MSPNVFFLLLIFLPFLEASRESEIRNLFAFGRQIPVTTFSSRVLHYKDTWKIPNCPMGLNIPIQDTPLDVCLSPKNIFRDIQRVLDDDSDGETDGDSLLEGFVQGKTLNSVVRGYLDDQRFYGSVQIVNATYWVEPLSDLAYLLPSEWNPAANHNAILTKQHDSYFDLVTKRPKRDERVITQLIDRKLRQYDASEFIALNSSEFPVSSKGVSKNLLFSRYRKYGLTCTMRLVGDRDFWKKVGRMRTPLAKRRMLYYVDEINAIFRSIDFNGDDHPDNIGLEVLEIGINKNLTTEGTRVGRNSRRYFIMATRKEKDFDKFCLGVIFTATPFSMKSFGYASEGYKKSHGICQKKPRPMKRPRNLMVVTVASDEFSILPTHLFLVSFLHQVGHAFGALEDSSSQELSCRVGDIEGGYVMGLFNHSEKNTRKANLWRFSICSIKEMAKKLLRDGNCLQTDSRAFCGNGLVEKGEECDCGMVMNCLRSSCCSPRGNPKPCTKLTDAPEYVQAACLVQDVVKSTTSFPVYSNLLLLLSSFTLCEVTLFKQI